MTWTRLQISPTAEAPAQLVDEAAPVSLSRDPLHERIVLLVGSVAAVLDSWAWLYPVLDVMRGMPAENVVRAAVPASLLLLLFAVCLVVSCLRRSAANDLIVRPVVLAAAFLLGAVLTGFVALLAGIRAVGGGRDSGDAATIYLALIPLAVWLAVQLVSTAMGALRVLRS